MTKKELTKEEEADEIVRRLSTPLPRKINVNWRTYSLDVEYEIIESLSLEIQKEIDRNIIEELKINVERKTRTP